MVASPPKDTLAPHNLDAEKAALGCIIVEAEALYDVVGFLKPADFYIHRYGAVYEAMLNLHQRREAIDFVTLMNELVTTGKASEVDAMKTLTELAAGARARYNVEDYGRIVENMSTRRRLLDAAGKIARAAHSNETDIDAVVSQSEQAFREAVARKTERSMVTMKQAAYKHFDIVQQRVAAGEVEGVKTYQRSVDRVLNVLRPGQLILVAARPGMGKTSWLLSVVAENAKRGVCVGLVSLEMSEEDVTTRLIAAEAEIPYKKIEAGELTEAELARWTAAVSRVSNWPLVIDDTPGITPIDLDNKVRRMVYEHGIEIIVGDYLQLMSGGVAYRGKDSRTAEVSYISAECKNIARRYNIPALWAAQLSRDVEKRSDRRPILSDLRESGSLEQDADVGIFLYRPAYYDPETLKGNITEIHIAKHRNGPTGMVEVVFLPEKMQFGDLAKNV